MSKLFEDFENKLVNISTTGSEQPEYETSEQKSNEQRTREWFLSRIGKFTGSVMPDLMKKGRGKELFGETSKKIIYQVVAERSMSPGGLESYLENLMKKEYIQTAWGNRYEPDAREMFRQYSGLEVKETGSVKHPDFPNFGSSVDFIAGEETPGEIKCPFDPVKHERILGMPDIIGKESEYFWQMQSHLLVTGADYCFFVSYDPRRHEKECLKVIECHRDNEAIAEMIDKLEKAEKIIAERFKNGKYNFDV